MKYVIQSEAEDSDDYNVTAAMSKKKAIKLFNSLTGCKVKDIGPEEELEANDLILREANILDLIEFNEDGTMDVQAVVDNMSDERLTVAYERAVREFGGVVADHDDPAFQAEMDEQVKKIVAKDLLCFMEKKGALTAWVGDDGELNYQEVK